MIPKPLSKEERAEILKLQKVYSLQDGIAPRIIQQLLEAEAFWREAVKKASLHNTDFCPWCTGDLSGLIDLTNHTETCPYRIAVEEE